MNRNIYIYKKLRIYFHTKTTNNKTLKKKKIDIKITNESIINHSNNFQRISKSQ